MIERTEGTCGGRARVAGTRIAVWIIVLASRRAPDSELLEMWPHLTKGDLKDARAYYEAHKEEIDKDIAEQRETEKK